MSQSKLTGGFTDDPLEFDCPICNKRIVMKRDGRGAVYLRNWSFHFAYEHGKTALKYVKDDISLWMAYWMFHNDDTGQTLRDNWKEKVKND